MKSFKTLITIMILCIAFSAPAMALDTTFDVDPIRTQDIGYNYEHNSTRLQIGGQALFIGSIGLQIGQLPANPYLNLDFNSNLSAVQLGVQYNTSYLPQEQGSYMYYSYGGVTLEMGSYQYQGGHYYGD